MDGVKNCTSSLLKSGSGRGISEMLRLLKSRQGEERAPAEAMASSTSRDIDISAQSVRARVQ